MHLGGNLASTKSRKNSEDAFVQTMDHHISKSQLLSSGDGDLTLKKSSGEATGDVKSTKRALHKIKAVAKLKSEITSSS